MLLVFEHQEVMQHMHASPGTAIISGIIKSFGYVCIQSVYTKFKIIHSE